MATRKEIQNTLQHPYDRVLFVKGVLHPVFRSSFKLLEKPQKPAVDLTKSESSVIDKVTIYGSIDLEDGTDVTCYEVLLQPSVRIEQSRVAIQQYVRKLLIAGQAALVNFVAPDNKDMWRFTLVAKDSKVTESSIKETETHPKRYTYLVEKDRPNRTMAERMETLSLTATITLEKLIDAFSVEAMTKAFFHEYKEHYQNFVEYLTGKRLAKEGGKWVEKKTGRPHAFLASMFNGDEKHARDFIKKLMGRIVFLYFVQKKRWLGATTTKYTDGSYDFIYKLFEQTGGDERFFPVGLSELFFNALNTKRKGADWKLPTGRVVKVPYLNGGLFERDEVDEKIHKKGDVLTFPPRLFSHVDKMDTPNARGFLDFLNAFNFTVYEDSQDDQTVAVDPEMLGHIFENLLEDNKDKGAFYTPKEIVHYMCQESLFEYLMTYLKKHKHWPSNQEKAKTLEGHLHEFVTKKTASNVIELDEPLAKALREVKICDPAIGSGAFPMGLLNEIFQCVQALFEPSPDTVGPVWGMDSWRPHEVKKHIIQYSIYGVDIEKGAVDIARLRFWLSLIVDEPEPSALPNLDFKIVVGDSLLPKFEGDIVMIDWDIKGGQHGVTEQSKLMKKIIEDQIGNLKKVVARQKEYFGSSEQAKEGAYREIQILKLDILMGQIKQELIRIGKRKEAFGQAGLFTTNTTETQVEIQKEELKLKKIEKRISKRILNKEINFDHFDWKLDFPEVMNEKLTDNPGFDIVIANPPYVDIKNLPSDLVQDFFARFASTENRINLYAIFVEKGWNLTNKSGILTYIIPNSLLMNSSYKKVRELLLNSIDKLIKLPDNIFTNAIVETIIIQALKGKEPGTILGAYYESDSKINFEQLRFNSFPCSNWHSDPQKRYNIFVSPQKTQVIAKIDQGKVVSIGSVFDFSLGITPYDSYKGHSKKLIENREFHSPTKKDRTYVPLISGSNILRFCVTNDVAEYLKYGDWLGAARQKRFFTEPRVVVRQIISGDPPRIYAGYTEEELYHTQIGFAIVPKDGSVSSKVLCGLLNSNLINFYHRCKFTDPEKDTFQKILIENCKAIPIPTGIQRKTQKRIESLVSNIQTSMANSRRTDSLEDQLNILVYRLYNLSYEEVICVQPEFSMTKIEYGASKSE